METMRFDIAEVDFAVSDSTRTITGLVAPWQGVSTVKGGKTFRFARESIKAVAAKFVKFFEDHKPENKRGRAIAMRETDEGLEMTFKVDPGEDGDRLLALAKSGVKTGLSVGVEFDDSDVEPDPEYPGSFLVKLANLFEVSLVSNPSFDSSRVITVMASADIGETMDETTKAVEAASTEPAMTQFSIPDGYSLVPNQLVGSPKPNVQEKPAVIVPGAANAVVNEPANYRFDSGSNLQPAKYDFGIDIIRGSHPGYNDLAARHRVEEFIRANFDIISTDVNELNPNINLPKYVDQRQYRSPVWDRINKGTVPNGVTAFTWPKFSSASGLVAQGTEGTEPTSGTLVTTNQSVQPTTLRGKAKISREVYDQGGIPGIGDLIWRQMTRGYYEALEAKAVAELDAASPAGITLTTGGGTTGQTLSAELIQAFAKLHYIRGGFSMDTLFAQVDLYLALVGARDGSGRPLFPAVGPMNANGVVGSRFGVLDINGVQAVPSWALAATGVVAASSYLFDSTAVDGWADAPRQLFMPEIEVSNVYVGIWGYAATAINDINGVRELIYDPA